MYLSRSYLSFQTGFFVYTEKGLKLAMSSEILKAVPVFEFDERGNIEYLVEFIENDDKPSVSRDHVEVVASASIGGGKKRAFDGHSEPSFAAASKSKKVENIDIAAATRMGSTSRKIGFGDIMEKLLEAGWREMGT